MVAAGEEFITVDEGGMGGCDAAGGAVGAVSGVGVIILGAVDAAGIVGIAVGSGCGVSTYGCGGSAVGADVVA